MRHPFIVPAACIAIAAGCSSALACGGRTPVGADLVLTHARIWTGDAALPSAEGVAVIGERIVAVGGADEIARWLGTETTVVDVGGRLVVPGFNDAHVHVVDGGMSLDSVDLSDAATPAELARRIAERAKMKPGKWIVGGNWDERRWMPATLPTRQMIDDGTNGTPVAVRRYDGRMVLVNSTVLGRAGISERTPDPAGGTIVRDEHGLPTGVLTDAATALVTRVLPTVTREERVRAATRAFEHAASLGVTSVHDMSSDYQDLSVYEELAERRQLTVRVYAAFGEIGWYDAAKVGIRHAFGSPWLRIGAVHRHASIEASTATADGMLPFDAMQTRFMAADHAGLQLCTEPAPDANVSRVLDLYRDVFDRNGARDRRFRVEHAESSAPADVDRFAAIGAVASIQPGRDHAAAAPLQSFVSQNVRLAFGSDWPRVVLNPMTTIATAVAPGAPQLSVTDAVRAYTLGSAFAEFQDTEKGTVTRGKLADLVVLSDDIFTIPPSQIKDVHVLTTIVGGRVVHQRRP